MEDNPLGRDENRPGYYASPLERYPGHIQFPDPLGLVEFTAWWKVAIHPLKNMDGFDLELFSFEWVGAKALLLEYGERGIKDVPKGKVKEDRVPLPVMSWVSDCADDYIFPQLPKKKQARLLTLT